MSDAQDLELEDWHTFLGSWATEAIHPMLPGAEIRARRRSNGLTAVDS
jgi:hypothetical protein